MTFEMYMKEREMEGETRGRKEGREEGKEYTTLKNLKSVMNALQVPVEKAMEILNIPEQKRTYYLSKLDV